MRENKVRALVAAPAALVVAALLLLFSPGRGGAYIFVEGFVSGARGHRGGSALQSGHHRHDEAKEAYLRAADEAHRKYYAKRARSGEDDDGELSKEEYLRLAMDAWTDGTAANTSAAKEPYFASSNNGESGIHGGAAEEERATAAAGGNPLDALARWAEGLFSPSDAGSPESAASGTAGADRGTTVGEEESVPYGLRAGTVGSSASPPMVTDPANQQGVAEGNATEGVPYGLRAGIAPPSTSSRNDAAAGSRSDMDGPKGRENSKGSAEDASFADGHRRPIPTTPAKSEAQEKRPIEPPFKKGVAVERTADQDGKVVYSLPKTVPQKGANGMGQKLVARSQQLEVASTGESTAAPWKGASSNGGGTQPPWSSSKGVAKMDGLRKNGPAMDRANAKKAASNEGDATTPLQGGTPKTAGKSADEGKRPFAPTLPLPPKAPSNGGAGARASLTQSSKASRKGAAASTILWKGGGGKASSARPTFPRPFATPPVRRVAEEKPKVPPEEAAPTVAGGLEAAKCAAATTHEEKGELAEQQADVERAAEEARRAAEEARMAEDEAERAEEEARWVEEQNALVQERLERRQAEERARSMRVPGKDRLSEETDVMDAVEARAKAEEEARWLEEQNALVQKRLETRKAEEAARAAAGSETPEAPMKTPVKAAEAAGSGPSTKPPAPAGAPPPPSTEAPPGIAGETTPSEAPSPRDGPADPPSVEGFGREAPPPLQTTAPKSAAAAQTGGPHALASSPSGTPWPDLTANLPSVPEAAVAPPAGNFGAAGPLGSAGGTPLRDDAASPQVNGEGTLVLNDVDHPWLAPLSSAEAPPLPMLHVGKRLRSGEHGTAHEAYLVLSAEEGDDGPGRRYNVQPCIAKRPWSLTELNATVPAQVMACERGELEAFQREAAPEAHELEWRAAPVRQYYEVELHIYGKIEKERARIERLRRQKAQDEAGRGAATNDDEAAAMVTVAAVAVPKFIKVHPDDGSGGPRADDAIPDYGATGADVWGKALGGGHEWLVYEGEAGATLRDALEDDQGGRGHRLQGVQRAMNLPDRLGFGDVLDVVVRSLLENLVFLSSCNIVHRDLRPSNLLCDPAHRRLRIANFGHAVDLDPPRVGLDNDKQFDAPASIANAPAADVFAAAMVACRLMFGMDEGAAGTSQLRGAGYDLDGWLRTALAAQPRPAGFDEGLAHLAERPGLWSLLKGAIRPNPLRKKITADSLRQFNEVLALKSGDIALTGEMRDKIDREESYLRYVIDGGTSGGPDNGVPSAKVVDAGTKTAAEDARRESGVPPATPASDEAFDITQVPFTLHPEIPTPSELRRQAERSFAAPKADATASETVAATAIRGTDDERVFDVTQLQFSPTRTSKLTDVMDSHAKLRAEAMARQQQKLAGARTHFRRPPPRPHERRGSGLVDVEGGGADVAVDDVLAPPGILGVVINTDNFGSVYVADVSESSPLRGHICRGDVIVAVDSADVTRFVAEEVVRILLRKESSRRIITVLRESDGCAAVGPAGAGDTAAVQTLAAPALEDEPCYQEVDQWLQSLLPSLRKQDAAKYCVCLIDDGFDCLETLDELLEEDLHFMKIGHKRTLLRKLPRLGSGRNLALPSSPEMRNVKKVYKVDEALGEAARKGIEAIIAEEKRRAKADAQSSRQESSESKADEAVSLNKEEDDRLTARNSELKRLADEARQLEDDQAWLAEQNELVKRRHAERVALEKRLLREEERDAALRREFEEEAKRLEESKAWIAAQNELVEERHRARSAKERQLREEAETEAVRLTQLREAEAWTQEQNELVEKRCRARLAEERQSKEDGAGGMIVDRSGTLSDEPALDSVSPQAPSSKSAACADEPIRSGMTAEEAETVRNARLAKSSPTEPGSTSPHGERLVDSDINDTGSGASVPSEPLVDGLNIRQGMTAEEAEAIRKARLSVEAPRTEGAKPPDPKAG
ncbi:hypothetical protein ACHAXT_000068 [Thalassiosira profunda]